jgi:hypothetical protein
MGCRISMDSRKSRIERASCAETVFLTLFAILGWGSSMHLRLFKMKALGEGWEFEQVRTIYIAL